jgi:FAD:protein FMN transferase
MANSRSRGVPGVSADHFGAPRVLFATAAMGTRFEIVIRAEETPQIHAIGEAAVAEILRLHALLSFYAPNSLLSHINRTAHIAAVRVDADTFALFTDAHSVWRASDGAFDITRGTGMDAVVLDEAARTIRFARSGISLDLGGIAKGHAVDHATSVLRSHGVTDALIHGGTSSVSAIGHATDEGNGWPIALASFDTGAPQTTVHLRDQSLSVSSGAIRAHIIDPATGAFITGPGTPRIAAVIGPTARLADAWSTALVVLGVRPDGLGPEWETFIE